MSPRTKEQFEAIREGTKRRIVVTATGLFADKGFDATSIQDIAMKAEISKGLIYNHFKSKHDLLDAIILEVFDEMDQMLEIFQGDNNDPLELIHAMMLKMFESLTQKPQFWKLIIGLSFKLDIKIRYDEQITLRKEKYFKAASKMIRQMGIDNPIPDLLFIGAIIDGMAFHYLEEPKSYPVDMMIETFKEKMNMLYGNKNNL